MLPRLALMMLPAAATMARAQVPDTARPPQVLPPAVVTVTREPARSALEVPYGVTTLRPDSTRPGLRNTALDELLILVPGVTTSSRTNPSQDPRLSIRGFGARSGFGVRSLRVLRDGIPLTLPDGQTPVDYLDLESVGRIEVLRGAASALYGNASGGVVELHTETPVPGRSAEGRAWTGEPRTDRLVAAASATAGATAWRANLGSTNAAGWRDHSRQQLSNGFGRLTTRAGSTELGVVVMGLHMPRAENPGALTRAQFDTDPTQADALSVQRRARKEVRQLQAGVTARGLGAREYEAHAYGGMRDLYNPLTFAVVQVDRLSAGAGARLTTRPRIGGIAHRLTAGADVQVMRDGRRNWANCNNAASPTTTCPIPDEERGAARLDQVETVASAGPYLRAETEIGTRARLTAGVRADAVRFAVDDALLSNGDDSGERTLGAVSPMVGLTVRVAPLHAIRASWSTAFETPTTTELGNQPDGGAGLNRELDPQLTRSFEIGATGVAAARLRYDVAVYHARVQGELIPFEAPGGEGRTYYRNAGRTRRTGAEIGGELEAGPVTAGAAYTWSHFRFADFVSDGVQLRGRTIPGVPEHQLQASVAARARRGFGAVEVVARDRVWANDENSSDAPGYALWNVRIGGVIRASRAQWRPAFGVNNVFDRRHASSVAINATGASLAATKFYEPGAGRTFVLGLRVGREDP